MFSKYNLYFPNDSFVLSRISTLVNVFSYRYYIRAGVDGFAFVYIGFRLIRCFSGFRWALG